MSATTRPAPRTMAKLPKELRVHLTRKLKALLVHRSMRVETNHERLFVMTTAKKKQIPVFTTKTNGRGFEITRLKMTPLHACPRCGYCRGEVVQ